MTRFRGNVRGGVIDEDDAGVRITREWACREEAGVMRHLWLQVM